MRELPHRRDRALALAVLVAFLSALILGLFISRQVVAPVREMMDASERIAGGYYDERVGLSASVENLDEVGPIGSTSIRWPPASLERTEALRGELIGNVAHELPPLSSIKGYMEGLIDGVLPAEPETFQQIEREAERLQRLVRICRSSAGWRLMRSSSSCFLRL